MPASAWLRQLQQDCAIAVVRAPDFESGRQMAHAVASGGIAHIEIAWNGASPVELIGRLRSELPECWIGAGTLLNAAQLQTAIVAGAQFLFAPHVDAAAIRSALAAEVPIVPGALSPTEIVTAWQQGATAVKVFPIGAMGGSRYVQSLQGPLGQIPLVPTGGITAEEGRALLEAGAVAVGLSSQLFPADRLEAGDWEAIAQQARQVRATLLGQSG